MFPFILVANALMVILGPLCLFIYLRHRIIKNGAKLPPGPWGLPIIGSLHMLGNLPHRTLEELAKKYGPIMHMRLGSVPVIVASSAEAAELILKTHDAVFASRPKLQSSKYLLFGAKGMAFTEYGPYWRSARKFCTLELLTAAKIESTAGMRREEVGLLLGWLKEAAAAGEVVDISDKVHGLVENMVYRMIFGRSKDERFDMKGIIHEAMCLAGAFNIADFVPFLGPLDLQGLNRGLKASGKAMDKILEIIIDEHEQDSSRHQKHDKDFVDVMLSMKNKALDDGEEFSNDRTKIKVIIIEMIVGAIDTAFTTIEWTMSELMKHPRVMKRLQEEITTVVGDDEIIKEVDLPKLEYLHMVIKESFRLHPVGPLLIPHESMEDIVINGNYIPKKSRVLVNTWAIGRDTNIWSKNADEFFPERFIGKNIEPYGRDFGLLPFGSGRRGCPGMNLGLTKVRLILASLVHCFGWKLPNGMSPTELDMDEKFGLTMSRENHLLAIPTYRF